jgi:hypothetical protein
VLDNLLIVLLARKVVPDVVVVLQLIELDGCLAHPYS